MKILKQTKESVQLELSPLELDIVRSALNKESMYRRKAWKTVEPKHPEELLYHFIMHDTAEEIKAKVHQGIQRYRGMGILK